MAQPIQTYYATRASESLTGLLHTLDGHPLALTHEDTALLRSAAGLMDDITAGERDQGSGS